MHPRKPTIAACHLILVLLLILLFKPRTVLALCEADCDADNRIEMSELITAVDVALGKQPTAACSGLSAAMTVVELVRFVSEAASGACEGQCSRCGDGVVDCEEECDAGGTCVGGANSGMACTSDFACGLDEPGRCEGGTGAYRQCLSNDHCGGGVCRRCMTFGGKPVAGGTCAANCTLESTLAIELKRGEFDTRPVTVILLSGSGSIIYDDVLGTVPLPLEGTLAVVAGKENANGIRPVTVKSGGLSLAPVDVASIACVCVRAVEAKTCGGVLKDIDGNNSPDCSAGFTAGDSVCTDAELPPCTFVHGEGNSATGELGCQGLSPIDVVATRDAIAIVPPNVGPPGSMLMLQHLASGTKTGSCEGFCTDDDPPSMRGSVSAQLFTTGLATAVAPDASISSDGIDDGSISVRGNPKVCSELFADPAGFKLASVLVRPSPSGVPTVSTTCLEAQ